jgi:uridine kinase
MTLATKVIAGTSVQVVELIEQKRQELCRPIVVGVSGYAGSGKSTLARAVVEARPGAVRVRGDDFLDPTQSHHRSDDWSGVERERLVTEVLRPFQSQRPGTFRRFDWARRELGAPEPLPTGDVLVVDLIGLFHPDVLPTLDVTIWVDAPLGIAQERGMRRDEALGRDFTHLWLDVWVPNEIDFERKFAPRDRADVLYVA